MSNKKYLLFVPHGGLNDCFTMTARAINYCRDNNRILLLDYTNSPYKINFSDYLYFSDDMDIEIISDSNVIRELISNNNFSVYPKQFDLKCFMENNIDVKYTPKGYLLNNEVLLEFPKMKLEEDIVFHTNCGGGMAGFKLFRNLKLKNKLKKVINDKLKLLKNEYASVQVRNTDYVCKYQDQYHRHKEELFKSKDCVYVATDNKDVLDFFKSKGLKIFNFTTFPSTKFINLFVSDVDSHTKFCDVFVDIFALTKSQHLFSNSHGFFIKLIRECRNHKDEILAKLK